MKLLVCGSRETCNDAIDFARRCVDRAKVKGYEIIVGDATGIDTEVVVHAMTHRLPLTIYGITRTARCWSAIEQTVKLHKVDFPTYTRCEGDFLARDRVMAEACDICIGVHNGISRGTLYTVNYARHLGKETHLRTFTNEQQSHEQTPPRA